MLSIKVVGQEKLIYYLDDYYCCSKQSPVNRCKFEPRNCTCLPRSKSAADAAEVRTDFHSAHFAGESALHKALSSGREETRRIHVETRCYCCPFRKEESAPCSRPQNRLLICTCILTGHILAGCSDSESRLEIERKKRKR